MLSACSLIPEPMNVIANNFSHRKNVVDNVFFRVRIFLSCYVCCVVVDDMAGAMQFECVRTNVQWFGYNNKFEAPIFTSISIDQCTN